MSQFTNDVLNVATSVGELIDTITAIFHGFGELFRAMHAILGLIGRLAGG